MVEGVVAEAGVAGVLVVDGGKISQTVSRIILSSAGTGAFYLIIAKMYVDHIRMPKKLELEVTI